MENFEVISKLGKCRLCAEANLSRFGGVRDGVPGEKKGRPAVVCDEKDRPERPQFQRKEQCFERD